MLHSQPVCIHVKKTDRECVYLDREVDEVLKVSVKRLAFSLNDAVGIYTDIHKHTAITDASSSVEQITVNNQAKGLHIMRSHIFLSSGYN